MPPLIACAMLGLALALLPGPEPLGATGDETQINAARALLERGDAAAAYARLKPLEDALAGDPNFDYLFGIAALGSGHPTEAVFALERAVAVQPDNALARAELARAYLSVNEVEESRRELQLVQDADDIPPGARAAIDRYLAALERPAAGDTTDFTGFVGLTFGYDGNVNSAPNDAQISIGGVSFVLDAAGREAPDAFLTATAGGGVSHPLKRNLRLNAAVSAQHRLHGAEDDFETTALNATVGLRLDRDRTRYTAGLQAQHFAVNGDANRNSVGVVAQVTRQLSTQSQGSAFAQAARLTYPSQRVRNANRYVGGLVYTRAYDRPGRPVVSGRVFLGREEPSASGAPHLGHDVAGGQVYAQVTYNPETILFASVGFDLRDYGGPDPTFTTERNDESLQLSMGANYVPAKSWRISPVLSFTRNNSNIPIDDYTRELISVSVLKTFD